MATGTPFASVGIIYWIWSILLVKLDQIVEHVVPQTEVSVVQYIL